MAWEQEDEIRYIQRLGNHSVVRKWSTAEKIRAVEGYLGRLEVNTRRWESGMSIPKLKRHALRRLEKLQALHRRQIAAQLRRDREVVERLKQAPRG